MYFPLFLVSLALICLSQGLAYETTCNVACGDGFYTADECRQPIPEVIIDSEDASCPSRLSDAVDNACLGTDFEIFGATWSRVNYNTRTPGSFGPSVWFTNSGPALGTFFFNATVQAYYNISVSYSVKGARSPDAEYTVNHEEGSSVVTVDMTTLPIDCREEDPSSGTCLRGFSLLGSFLLSPLRTTTITLNFTLPQVVFDAVAIVPTDQDIVDGRASQRCEPCNPCNGITEYALENCSSGLDTVCNPVVNCLNETQFEILAPTRTSNRVCDGLVECVAGEEFEAVPPTATTNRECQQCSPCGNETYETGICLPGSDRQCTGCTTCNSTISFEAAPCTNVTDRACQDLIDCSSNEFEIVASTATTDRECQNISSCHPVDEYIAVRATATSDRICGAVTECSPGTVEMAPPTRFSNRVCIFDGVCSIRDDEFDLFLLLDGSGSVGPANFEIQKQFAINLIQNLPNISFDSTRIGVGIFAFNVTMVFDFRMTFPDRNPSLSDKANILAAIEKISFPSGNQPTATGLALNYLSTQVLLPNRGFRGPGVIIIVTDGRSVGGLSEVQTASQNLQDRHDVEIISIGIGDGVSLEELVAMSSDAQDGPMDYTLTFDSFEELLLNSSLRAIGTASLSCGPGLFENIPCSDVSDSTCSPCTTNCGDGYFISGNCVSGHDTNCTTCSGDCPVNQYILEPCNGVHDRICSGCSGPCAPSEYEISCNTTSDRQCLTCSVECPLEQFISQNCSQFQDLICSPCSAPCGTGFFETVSCNTDHDRECQACASACPSGTYEIISCSGTSDRVCEACDVPCANETFASIACNATTNQECQACDTCPEDYYETAPCTPDQNRLCSPCLEECGEDTYESQSCTQTSNRVCSNCTNTCGMGFYENVSCTLLTDRECVACSGACPDGQYQSQGCTATSDRICSVCTACRIEEFVEQACNATNDTVCAGCEENCFPGFYEASSCIPDEISDRDCRECRTECPIGFYQGNECTPFSDLECIECYECGPNTYETSPCTASTDRQCSLCDSCSEGEYTTVACSNTTNRVCDTCSRPCIVGTFENVSCTQETNRECVECATPCNNLEYELSPCRNLVPAPFGERTCALLTICNGAEFQSAPASPSTDRECLPRTTDCGDERFSSVPATTTSDTVCNSCRPPCNESEYLIQECTFEHDRICAPCSVCPTGQFAAQVCSGMNDTTCSSCNTEPCEDGTYESLACSQTADRSCSACDECDFNTTFQSADCLPNQNRRCAEIRECSAVEIEVAGPTHTTDRNCNFTGVCSSSTPFNLVFLLDGSGSIRPQNFEISKEFAVDLIQQVHVSIDTVRVAIILFENNAVEIIDFNNVSNNEDAYEAVRSIQYPTGNRATTTASAFIYLAEVILDESKGFRPEFETIVVTITDGPAAEGLVRLQESVLEVDDAAGAGGLTRIAIGVDRYNEAHLIATASSVDDIFTYATFDKLTDNDVAGEIGSKYMGCLTGSYQTVACTLTNDRQCAPCSGCEVEYFQTQSCSQTVDTTCERCTQCNISVELVPCTPTSDRQCAEPCDTDSFQYSNGSCAVLTSCAPNTEYELSSPTRFDDRICATYTVCNINGGEYEQVQATFSSDRECSNCTACSSQEFEVRDCTSTSDRVCVECVECGASQYQNSSCNPSISYCTECSTCGPEEFVYAPCGTTSDTVCAPCTVCTNGTQETSRCGDEDRVCSICSPECEDDEYESTSCTPTTNRLCLPCSNGCSQNEFEIACSNSSDRVCQMITDCSNIQFESSPPTRSSDRICHNVTICDLNTEYIVAELTTNSDRRCESLTICPPGTDEITPPTSSSDRTCSFDGVCSTRTDSYNLVLVIDGSGSVTAPNFEYIRNFSKAIVNSIDNISPNGARIAVVLYGGIPIVIADFFVGSNRIELLGALDTMEYPLDNQPTGTATALNFLADTFLSSGNGYQDTKTFILVITDGPAAEGTQSLQAAVLRLEQISNIEILAVGVENYDTTQLAILASFPDIAFEYATFDTLVQSSTVESIITFLSCVDGFFLYDSCTADQDRICRPCSQSCSNTSTFLSGECRGMTDYSCSPCSGDCEPGYYSSSDCDGVSDRMCTPCSGNCSFGQFRIDCTPTNDRICQTCSNTCPVEYFKIENCTSDQDRTCALCSENCAAGSFESISCSFEHDRECTQCSGSCPIGTFEVSPCSGTEDRRCGFCSGECPRGYYESMACNSTHDRECMLCDECGDETYEVAECTSVQNRQCDICDEECTIGFIEVTSCTPTSNRACDACSQSCEEDQFELVECTISSDRQCLNCTECSDTEFEISPCTVSSDRQCQSCTVCPDEEYASMPCLGLNDTVCSPCRERCFFGQFESISCTPYSNRICTDCTLHCNDQEFISSSCTEFNDTQCTPCSSECVDNTYYTGDCTLTADRVCTPCDRCLVGEYGVVPCTDVSNRVCGPCRQPCGDGEFESVSCTDDSNRECSTCSPPCNISLYFEESPCSQTGSDRVCSLYSVCGLDQFEYRAPSPSSDRICLDFTACEFLEFQSVFPTPTSDRVCSSCTTSCEVDEYMASPCTYTADAECLPITSTCETDQYVMADATPSSDLLCLNCTTQCETDYYIRRNCSESSDTVCSACSEGCPANQYASTPCTLFSDRICSLVTTPCDPDTEYQAITPSLTTDRLCLPISECNTTDNLEFEHLPPTLLQDRICHRTTICADGYNETQSPTPTTDRECVFNGVCSTRSRGFDLVFLLDASGSIGEDDFQLLKTFAVLLVRKIGHNIGAQGMNQVRVAAATFAFQPEASFDFLEGTSLSDIETLLFNISYPNGNLGTATAGGINFVIDHLFDPDQGYRDTDSAVVVVTDGLSSEGIESTTTASNRLHAVPNTTVISVGVGEDIGLDELNVIATADDLVFTISSFEELQENATVEQIISAAFSCDRGSFELNPCLDTDDRVCVPCRRNCDDGFYLTGSCTGTHDFSCTICSPECNPGEYEVSPCDGINDRVCAPCSGPCGDDHFRIECAEFSDRICQSCSTECPNEEYKVDECSAASDILCAPCTESCGPLSFESQSCTTDHNRVCSPCNICVNETFETGACTLSSDRLCSTCSPACDNDTYESQTCDSENDRICSPCTECDDGFYEISECTPTSNRQCAPCDSSCENGYFIAKECNSSENLVCEACSPGCDDQQFESAPCTQTSDLLCSNCSTSCPTSTFLVSECNATSDQVCQACSVCADETFEAESCSGYLDTTCTPCRENCVFGYFESTSCTPTSNRQCSRCTQECPPGFYEGNQCTITSDLECTRCTDCGSNFYESAECTVTTDRQCSQCSTCDVEQFAAVACNETVDTVCLDCTPPCSSGFFENEPCSVSSDRECSPCSPACEIGQYQVQDCQSDYGDRICLPLTPCTEGTFQSTTPTSSSDRECSPIHDCIFSEIELTPPTLTSDRICVCAPGYRENIETSSCEDINECLELDECDQTCTNSEGSFSCSCAQGFSLSNETRCSRIPCGIPEIRSISGDISAVPIGGVLPNMSFDDNTTIQCLPGYQTSDGFTLFSVRCTADGQFEGVGSIGITCENIDECISESLNTCEDQCIDTDGSFTCACNDVGFKLAPDNNTCDDLFDATKESFPTIPTTQINGDYYLEGSQPHGPTVLILYPFKLLRSFTIVSTFRQAKNTGGFLLSKSTESTGLERTMALYLFKTKPAVKFFYRVQGLGTRSVTFHFAFPLNDGHWHRLMLSVNGTSASLYIDGLLIGTRQLVGEIDDCINNDRRCLAFVGMRQSPDGANLESPFTGVIRTLYFRLRTALTVQPEGNNEPTPDEGGDIRILNPLSNGTFLPTGADEFSLDPPLRFPGNVALQSHVDFDRNPREDSVFTITLSVIQRCFTRGYLFAKSNLDGSIRYFSLYSTGSNIVMYYKPINEPMAKIHLGGAIGDGKRHRIMLAVDILGPGLVARLSIDDDVVAVRPLDGVLDVCEMHNSSDGACPLFFGGRSGGFGTSRYQLEGVMDSAKIYTRHAYSFNPSIPQEVNSHQVSLDTNNQQYIDLLSRPQFGPVRGGVDLETANNSVVFYGTGSVLLMSNPTPQLDGFSVVSSINLEAGSSGYIFAKTDASGRLRYYALFYSNTLSSFLFYYMSGGVMHVARNFTNPIINDEMDHTIMLTISNNNLTITVDGQSSSDSLVGPLDDCGPASQHCLFYIGQRASLASSGGAHRITGTLNFFVMYSDLVLDTFPTFIDGLYLFSRQPFSYISQRNNITLTDTTLAECVQQCRSNSWCASFDMGISGTSKEGQCYLSSSVESEIAPDILRVSSQLDYYERSEDGTCSSLI